MTIRLSTQHTIRRRFQGTLSLGSTFETASTEPARVRSTVHLHEADLEPLHDRNALLGLCIGLFEIDAFLGEGSYARVWKGTHKDTRVPVAIKIATGALDVESREEFQREIETLARLRHPNVVHVYDAGTIDEALESTSTGLLVRDTPYVVMEFASRGTLENLRRPITWQDFVRMAIQLLDGLAHAHARGVLHRDIKPANVLLGSTKDLRSHIKLADFGIAFSLDGAGDKRDPANEVEPLVLGTPLYMAPEQFLGTWRDYGPATDLYSFGIVAWELLTGDVPFNGTSFHQLAMQHWSDHLPLLTPELVVPPGVREWLEKLLAKDARDRFQFARHAAEALLALGDPIGTTPDPNPVRLRTLPEIATSSHLRDEPVLPALALSLLDVRPTPTLGRDEEFERLTHALQRALHGTGRGVVTLRGASGVGISHIGARLVEALHEAGQAQTLALFCDDSTHIEDAMRSAVRGVLRVDGLEPERTRARVHELCGEVADEIDVFALVTWLDGAVDRDLSIFIDWFLRLGTRAPLVLWVDSSGSGVDVSGLLASLLDRSLERNARCVVLHTDSSVRILDPSVRNRWAKQGAYHVEALRPLDSATIERVLDATLPFSPELRGTLVEMSMGMPGRALQAIRRWARDDRLEVRDGRVKLREPAR